MPAPAWKKTLKDRQHTQARKLTGFFPKNKLNCQSSLGKPRIPVVPVDWPNFLHKTQVPKAMRRYFGASDSPHGGQITPNIVLPLLKSEAKGKHGGHLTTPLTATAQHSSCWFIGSLLLFIALLCSPGEESRQQKSNKIHTSTLELGDNVSLERQNYFFLLTEGTLVLKMPLVANTAQDFSEY